jgi:creatinine amidohydrolase
MRRGPGCYLERLSWPEAEVAMRHYVPALLPLGAGSKEHGMHLPLATDRVQADYLCTRLVEQLPVLALPTLTYGYYPAFLEYPGSVSVRLEACRDSVEDICRSLATHGADRIYLLNTGISTNWALEPTRLRLATLGILMDYTDLRRLDLGAAAALVEQPAGSHADEVETSRMLYMAPDLVRMDLARSDFGRGNGRGPLSRDPRRQDAQYSPSGVFGDPTLATAEKGKLLTEALLGCLINEIEALASADYQPPPPRRDYL